MGCCGFTVTVAVIAVPVQLLAVGVMVKVTVIGALVAFVKVPLISPVPLSEIPVTSVVWSLVQANTVPVTLPLRPIVVIATPEQTVCEDGFATAFGVGLTSTVAVIATPGQLLAVGVMVKVTVIGELVVFVKVPLISPDPLPKTPFTSNVWSLVQLNVVFRVLPVRPIVVIVAAEQIVCEDGFATAFGVGLTVTVKVVADPVHPFAVAVTLTVAVTGELVKLVAV
jgi:hypothetical protein